MTILGTIWHHDSPRIVKGLLGLGASSFLPQQERAVEESPIPVQGIVRRIRHVSYSDSGGRPDGSNSSPVTVVMTGLRS